MNRQIWEGFFQWQAIEAFSKNGLHMERLWDVKNDFFQQV